jgi:hypothetical protein
VIYRLVVHVAAPAGAGGLAALDGVLAAGGVQVEVAKVHADPDGQPVFHIEARHEAPSAYHAANISGAELFSRLLADPAVGLDGERIEIVAERFDEPAPA